MKMKKKKKIWPRASKSCSESVRNRTQEERKMGGEHRLPLSHPVTIYTTLIMDV